ncbi:MAG: hypothetical protein Fur005_34810 [Roseiflexaceae bacterium]
MATTTMAQPTTTRSAWRSVGLWFTGLLMAYMIFNTFRATLASAAFAETFGVPISDPAGLWFVLVYAS